MPLIYGEGKVRAFKRLQESIIKESDDQSIFAWALEPNLSPLLHRPMESLLADAPSAFRASGTIIETDPPQIEGYMLGIRTATEFGNRGIHITLPLIRRSKHESLAVLACTHEGLPDSSIAICLRDMSTNGGRYMREELHMTETVPMNTVLSSAAFERFFVTRVNRIKRFSPCQPEEKQDTPTPRDSAFIPVIPEEDFKTSSPGDPAATTVNEVSRVASLLVKARASMLYTPELGRLSMTLLLGGCALLLLRRPSGLLEHLRSSWSVITGSAKH